NLDRMNHFRPLATALLFVALSTAAYAQDDIPTAYDRAADEIIHAALEDQDAWDRLAYMVDTFGPRFSGTQNLEDAIDWVLEVMRLDGLENVRGEEVMVPRWV